MRLGTDPAHRRAPIGVSGSAQLVCIEYQTPWFFYDCGLPKTIDANVLLKKLKEKGLPKCTWAALFVSNWMLYFRKL